MIAGRVSRLPRTLSPPVATPAFTAAVAALVCAACRMAYLLSPRAQFNADEATTGIMVREILRGRFFPFYPGQHYGGTPEPYLQAAAYAILRLPQNPLTLRLTQVALSSGTCVLVYLVAARLLPSRAHAVFAATLFAVAPWYNVIGTASSMSFYTSSQTVCMAVIYSTLRLTDDASNRRLLAIVGVLFGFALWTTATSLFYLLPVFIWLLPLLGRNWRRWALWSTSVLLGGSPMFAWILRHRQLPLPGDPGHPSSAAQRLGNLLNPVFREYVGVTYAHARGGLPPVLQWAVILAVTAVYAATLWRRRWLSAFWSLNLRTRQRADLLLAVPPVVLVSYVASSNAWYTGTPRYLLITYPLLAIGIAALLPKRPGRRMPAAGCAVVVVSAILSLTFFRTVATAPSLTERDVVFSRVAAFLEAEHETSVYAGYWTAMPLQYDADRRLVVAVCQGARRFPEAQRSVDAAPTVVYVTSSLDVPADAIGAALRRKGIGFRSTRIGFVTIYDRLVGAARPADLGL